MRKIENSKIKENLFLETLENGLKIMLIPKTGVKKKYMIWGTNYGSIDSKFIVPGEQEITEVPMGIAHFLEHKMFEQPNGTNSLDTLTALGVDANAYTTNDHTAYLFEATDNFYEAMTELMDYVQHPYFTDENVEKEKGIIGQEINMYDDSPEWKVYLNALSAMYHNNPVKMDIAGTIDSISKINKEILYKCYNTFYNPSNMAIVICGDFNPEEMLEEVKSRLLDVKSNGEIKRIYPEEPETVAKEKIEQKFEVSKPIYAIGIKDVANTPDVKKHLAIEILLNMLIGKSSELYQELYNSGIISGSLSVDYEFSKTYAHIMIIGQADNPEIVYDKIKEQIRKMKENGVDESQSVRIKKKVYGEYVKQYDSVEDIAKMFLADFFKDINSFDYLDKIEQINVEYLNDVLNSVFKEDKMVMSVVKN